MESIKAKQCEMNIRAWLDHFKIPQLELVKAEEDRCFFSRSLKTFGDYFYVIVTTNPDYVDCSFVKCKELNYRENLGRYSAEITFHLGHIEIDFDYWNPYHAFVFTFMHFWTEWLWHKITRTKTNPFKIMKGLRNRGIKVKDVRNVTIGDENCDYKSLAAFEEAYSDIDITKAGDIKVKIIGKESEDANNMG